MRAPGERVSTSGRRPRSARNRSHTASLIVKVANSRLLSGERIAFTSTRMVSLSLNHSGHRTASAASWTSRSLR